MNKFKYYLHPERETKIGPDSSRPHQGDRVRGAKGKRAWPGNGASIQRPPSTGPRGTCFCVWLLSLSIMPGKSVCAMAWSTPLLFLITVEYAGHTVVSLSVRWLLDCWIPAHVGEVVNSAALEGLVHALW